MSPVYRHVDGDGWIDVEGEDAKFAPGPNWRLATFPEWLYHSLTKARFSWVELLVIVVVGGVVAKVLGWR